MCAGTVFTVPDQLVHERLPARAAMSNQVFHLHQAIQVHAQLRFAPLRVLAQLSAAKAVIAEFQYLLRTLIARQLINQRQQLAGLWWQFIERAAQHFVRELVGHRDVIERDFDVFQGGAGMHQRAYWPLVLMQQRNAVDQGEVLFVFAPCAGFAV